MKKAFRILLSACLSLAMLCCMAYAVSTPSDGLYTVAVTTNASMFQVTKCVLRVEDGQLYTTMTMSGTGYGYLFPGTGAEADAAGKDSWSPYRIAENGAHMFTIAIPTLDTEIHLASYSIKYDKWYDRTVTVHSTGITPYREVPSDGFYSALTRCSTLSVSQCLLRVQDGLMSAELTIDGKLYTLSPESLDTRIPLTIGETTHLLSIESASLLPVSYRAADGVYSASAETDSKLFKIENTVLTVKDGELTASITTADDRYDALFPGTAAQALRAPSEQYCMRGADGSYSIPVSSLDQPIPCATFDQSKNRWYDRTITFDSTSLRSENGTAAELVLLLPEHQPLNDTIAPLLSVEEKAVPANWMLPAAAAAVIAVCAVALLLRRKKQSSL